MRNPGRLALLAICSAWSGAAGPARTADWLEVGAATNGIRLYVDAASVVAVGGGVRVEQRFVFPKHRSHRLSRVDQSVVYTCGSREARTLRSVEFDKVGRRVRVDGAGVAYGIAPGTLPQYVFDLVC